MPQATAVDDRRRARLALAVALGLIPLLYYFTSTAEGAEPRSKSSLKWRSRTAVTTADNAVVTGSTKAEDETSDAAPVSAEPKQLAADDSAKPIGDAKNSAETKPTGKMRRDNEVRLTQATNPLSKNPLDDPYGDNKAAPVAPRLLGEPKSPLDTGATAPRLPRADELAVNNGGFQQEDCEKVKKLKSISQITNIVAASQGDLPNECYFDETVVGPMNRSWMPTTYTWKASGLCHKPLYFEEVALERYGHSTGPISQPIVSGAHFFATLPLLPYKMGLNAPWECKYALGYYRPGSCAPYIVPPIPISGRAIAAEAAAVSGAIFIFP